MTDIADLERRVIALEAAQGENTKTLHWVVGTLGRLSADVSLLKDDVKDLRADMKIVKAEISGLRRDLPSIVADAMREVLAERKP